MKYFKPFLGVAILLTFIYLCFELIPPFFKNYQFQDFLDSEARRTSYTTLTEDAIRSEVLKEARSDDLPIAAEQVHGPVTAPSDAEPTSAAYFAKTPVA